MLLSQQMHPSQAGVPLCNGHAASDSWTGLLHDAARPPSPPLESAATEVTHIPGELNHAADSAFLPAGEDHSKNEIFVQQYHQQQKSTDCINSFEL